ncbi:MAG: TIGR01906 family membrane protein [Clostridiales bacterium]|nr:TIGR01906 family membrane protein [Clostridiales bacterium]
MDIRLSKATRSILGFIAASLLIFILFLTALEWVAFDMNYYDKEYKSLGISASTGMSHGDLLMVTGELLDYIKDKRDDLDILAAVNGEERLVFNQREIDHMVDVKGLFTKGYKMRWLLLGGFLLLGIILFITDKGALRGLCVSYLWALSALIAFAIILLILILVDFTAVWTVFHLIFFTNDLWLLDPATDILIRMVPEKFFFDTVMRVLGLFGAILAALAVGAAAILRRGRRAKAGY